MRKPRDNVRKPRDNERAGNRPIQASRRFPRDKPLNRVDAGNESTGNADNLMESPRLTLALSLGFRLPSTPEISENKGNKLNYKENI